MTTKNNKDNVDYIFKQREDGSSRFDWIEKCLLGDIRTFLDGIEHFINIDKADRDPLRGGGNLAVPILIGTALELVSALYEGKSKYNGNDYDATNNVKAFIQRYFPDDYRAIPQLLWDGVRNGLVHTFSPKAFTYNGASIRFVFYVEGKSKRSHVFKENSKLNIYINVFELFEVLKESINEYKTSLQTDITLQDKFIKVWKIIESYERNCDKSNEHRPDAIFIINKATSSNQDLWVR